MEGVAGISRPRRRPFPGGGPKARSPRFLSTEYAPLRRKVKRAVKSPQLHRPLSFGSINLSAQLALHGNGSRAM